MEIIKRFLDMQADHFGILEEYSKFATGLMRMDEEEVKAVTSKLNESLITWAKENSPVYKDFGASKIYTRSELADRESWYVKMDGEYHNSTTSGSTTGEPFGWRTLKKYVPLIEDDNQYGMILEEFGFNRDEQVLKNLVLMKLSYNPPIQGFSSLREIEEGPYHIMHTHKAKKSVRYFVSLDGYFEDPEGWHAKLFELLAEHEFDVVLSTGPMINSLCFHIRKLGFKKKICRLLSHTGEFPIKADFKFLKDNGYIENFCDSMRCWDGGAMFFTCKFGTYHLMDNLGKVTQGPENKMISTDYFSLMSPFLNYWNGDLCEASEDYERCQCGRLYRKFRMLENRPFGLKGSTKLTAIKKEIGSLGFKSDISQVKFENLSCQIVSVRELVEEEQKVLKNILHEYECSFLNQG